MTSSKSKDESLVNYDFLRMPNLGEFCTLYVLEMININDRSIHYFGGVFSSSRLAMEFGENERRFFNGQYEPRVICVHLDPAINPVKSSGHGDFH